MAGLGSGVMSGAFSMVNVLADMYGPGTIGIHGDSHNFFLASGEQLSTCRHDEWYYGKVVSRRFSQETVTAV